MRVPFEAVSLFALIGGVLYVISRQTEKHLRYAAVGALWIAELLISRSIGSHATSRYFSIVVIPAVILSAVLIFAIPARLEEYIRIPRKWTKRLTFVMAATLVVLCLAKDLRVANTNQPALDVSAAIMRDKTGGDGDYTIVDFSKNAKRFRYLHDKRVGFVPEGLNTDAAVVAHCRKMLSPLPAGRVHYFVCKERSGGELLTAKALGVPEKYFRRLCRFDYLPRKTKQLSLYRFAVSPESSAVRSVYGFRFEPGPGAGDKLPAGWAVVPPVKEGFVAKYVGGAGKGAGELYLCSSTDNMVYCVRKLAVPVEFDTVSMEVSALRQSRIRIIFFGYDRNGAWKCSFSPMVFQLSPREKRKLTFALPVGELKAAEQVDFWRLGLALSFGEVSIGDLVLGAAVRQKGDPRPDCGI